MNDTFDTTGAPAESRRSIVLRLAAWVANLYLIAFAAGALLALADWALRAAAPNVDPALMAVRTPLGLVVLAASILMPGLLLSAPIPKLPFVLPIAFVLLTAFGQPIISIPLPVLVGGPLLIAMTSFLLLHARTGGWLLAAARLPRTRHPVVRVMLAMVALAILPLIVSGMLVSTLVTVVERECDGYVDITRAGIDARESVLVNDDHTVILMAMMHVGDASFYETLFDRLPAGSLVLAEGITDREKLLPGFAPASRLANVLGLTQQPSLKKVSPAAGPEARPDVIAADIDVSDFSETTLDLLRTVGAVYASDSIAEAWRLVAARKHPRDDLTLLRREVIDKRNAKVLAVVDEKAAGYRSIVIPWGAMHMPGLEKGLRERGYRIETERTRAVVRFGSLLAWPR